MSRHTDLVDRVEKLETASKTKSIESYEVIALVKINIYPSKGSSEGASEFVEKDLVKHGYRVKFIEADEIIN